MSSRKKRCLLIADEAIVDALVGTPLGRAGFYAPGPVQADADGAGHRDAAASEAQALDDAPVDGAADGGDAADVPPERDVPFLFHTVARERRTLYADDMHATAVDESSLLAALLSFVLARRARPVAPTIH